MTPLLPKPERVRVPEYREWLAAQVCCACGRAGGSVGHHVETGGVGTKGSDLLEIPLCQSCHRQLHDHGARPFVTGILGQSFTWYYQQVARHLARWLIEEGVLLVATRQRETVYVTAAQARDRAAEKLRLIRNAAAALVEACDAE